MGLGNGGLDFLVAEVLVLETVSFRHCAARSPYLDDIRPVADGLPHSLAQVVRAIDDECHRRAAAQPFRVQRSEEHTSELQSLMRRTNAGFSLKKKNNKT